MRRAVSILSVGWLLLLAWTPAATAFHDDGCNDPNTDYCRDRWRAPPVVNPAWWETPQAPHMSQHNPGSGISNQAAWYNLSTQDAVMDPFIVNMTVTGTVVGSIDIFLVQRDQGSDRITPDCPQGFLDYLLPNNGSPGSPSHVNKVDRLVRHYHQTVVPVSVDVDTTDIPPNPSVGLFTNKVSIELPRDGEYVVVFDARAGTNLHEVAGDPMDDSLVEYEIFVESGEFNANKIEPMPDRPFDPLIWSGNANACLPP